MEHHVGWKLKPSYLIGVLAISFHDSISRWPFLCELENEFGLLDAYLRLELKWRVWNNDVVLGNDKVMHHSWRFNWNVQMMYKFSFFVEQRVINGATLHIISEAEKLSGFFVYFWVSRNVVG